jgi:hypothetical protein
MRQDPAVEIRLTADEALVLSDWIYRLEEQEDALDDEAVWVPLHTIARRLDKSLIAIFTPDYQARIEAARLRLLGRNGPDDPSRPSPSGP